MLEAPFLGNPLRDWAAALAVVLLFFLLFALVRRLVSRHIARLAARTETDVDDFVFGVLGRTRQFLLVLPALYLGSLVLDLSARAHNVVRALAILSLLVQIGIWALVAIDFWVARTRRRRLAGDAASATLIGVLGFVAKLFLWTVVLLVALDNLGVDITALVTGLGIGGIAVALAVQNILGDLLASLSIVLDKPFVVGDAITVGEFTGTVENIGLKTTRLRSAGGEQIVFANGDLLQSRIRNWQRMSERRVVLVFAVAYGTPPDKLARIPGLVRETVEAQADVRFDRAHLRGFGAVGIEFEAVWWVLSTDYTLHMDRQQAIHLAVARAFETEGIELAHPSRVIVGEGRPEAARSSSPLGGLEKGAG